MLRSLILSSLMFCASSGFAMTIVGFDGEPFYFKNGSEGIAGACHEIMQKLCDKEKLHCKFKIASLPQVLEMMKTGKADATCPLSETQDRTEYIGFSNKVFKTRFAFFGLPDVATKVIQLKDLSGLSVGVNTPSRVSESLEEIRQNSPVKFEIIKESSNISTLMRAEKISTVLAYINHEIAMRWIEKSHSPLVEAPLKGEILSYNIGFSKKTLSNEKIARYVTSIQEITDDKETQDSVAKLGLTLWSEATSLKTEADVKSATPAPTASIVPASTQGLTPSVTPSPLATAVPGAKEKSEKEDSE
ncbi:substrate-binding periplasmic protein [Bdellovibrio bacteriovorus]|nr:transporter substrate-binding domain-containing protein [Bdellovibrio bacteriovorus]